MMLNPFPWAYSVGASSLVKSLFKISPCFKIDLGAREITPGVQCLLHKHEDLSLAPRTHIEQEQTAHICNPSASAVIWEAQTREFVKAYKPANLRLTVVNKRICLKVKIDTRLSSELHTCSIAYLLCTNTHTHTPLFLPLFLIHTYMHTLHAHI